MVNRPVAVADKIRVNSLLYLVSELARTLILLGEHPEAPILLFVLDQQLHECYHDFQVIRLQEDVTKKILCSRIRFF